MTLKAAILCLALGASTASAADTICMADETNTRVPVRLSYVWDWPVAAMNTTVPDAIPPVSAKPPDGGRRFHFKLNPYISQTGYYVVEESGAVQKSK